ncbi:unnamed protein product [Sphagnum tenellum]
MAGEGAQVPAVVSAAAGGQQQQQQAPSMTHSSASGLPATLGPMSAASAGTSAAATAASQLQQQQQLSYQMQQFSQNQAKTQQAAARVQYAQSTQLQVPGSQQLMTPTQAVGNPLSRSGSGQRLSHIQQQGVAMVGASRPSAAGIGTTHYNTPFLSSSSVPSPGASSPTMLMAQQRAAGQGQQQQQQQRPSSIVQANQSRPGIYGLQQPPQQLASGSYAHHLNPIQSAGGVVARPAVQGTPQYGVQSQLSLPQQHAMQVMQARQKQVQGAALPTHFQTTATPVQQAMAIARTGGGLASPQQQQQQNQQCLTQQLQQQNPSRSSQPQQMAPSNQPQQTWQAKPTGYQQQHQTQPPQQRAQVIGSNQQRPATLTTIATQPGPIAQQPTSNIPASNTLPPDSTGHILGKRSIQELVAQVDPKEQLDPDLEDVLLEIADDFIDSVTSFACTLAKHRKSSMLEAKDVLLHLERNWHITVPGFGSEEYRAYKRPTVSETHKQRLALVRKSVAAGQPGTESKGVSAGAAVLATNPSSTVSTPNKVALSSMAAGLLVSPMASPGLPRVPRV